VAESEEQKAEQSLGQTKREAIQAVILPGGGGMMIQALCYWKGESYSQGAVVVMGDGKARTCGSDGTWS